MTEVMHTENDVQSARQELAAPKAPQLHVRRDDGRVFATLTGVWATHTVAVIDSSVRALEAELSCDSAEIDMTGVGYLDTAGAWVIHRLLEAFRARGIHASLVGVRESHQVLLDAVHTAMEEMDEAAPPVSRDSLAVRVLVAMGQSAYRFRDNVLMALHILGAAVRGSQMKLGHGSGLSVPAVVSQIEATGVRAIPIIVLMSTIIGAIIAQQGAFQLRYFGAEIFVVDLVGILVLREIGVLLTAIMIAGRSGSAITAEIGSMKMREEIDALTVIGLNPIGVLVFPRLVALVIALPLLTFISNIAALGGAMFVAQTYSGISPDAFIARVRDAIDLTTVFAGLIKAPFMAIIIGVIASVEGMKVGGSAESLGHRVTASVVKSIFVVIVVDGVFAMFFAAVDF